MLAIGGAWRLVPNDGNSLNLHANRRSAKEFSDINLQGKKSL
ncbi:hypothetical protein AB3G45_01355 [Shinella sp. S4-D37]